MIRIKTNCELKVREITDCICDGELIYWIKDNLEYLESHNKNYTKKQYNTIYELLQVAKLLTAYPIETEDE